MKDDLEELMRQQETNPSLRGWSDGDEERPVPVPEGDNGIADMYWRQPQDWKQRQITFEDQVTEFPLYYSNGRRDRGYWVRRCAQLQATSNHVEVRDLVLTVSNKRDGRTDMLVLSANNIWKLLWLFVKSKFRREPKKKSKIKLPKYAKR